MVQGAIYDAVNATTGVTSRISLVCPPPRGASQAAAVAQAAHDVLYGITPGVEYGCPRLGSTPMLTASLALIDSSQAKTDGIEIGADAAAAMLSRTSHRRTLDVEPRGRATTRESGGS